jgi:hypothetical protein
LQESASWIAEGAYINLQMPGDDLDQHPEAESVTRWINEAASIAPAEMREIVRPRGEGRGSTPAKLLEAAAGFAWFSTYCYSGPGAKSSMETYTLEEYAAFLSASVLREIVGTMFRPG